MLLALVVASGAGLHWISDADLQIGTTLHSVTAQVELPPKLPVSVEILHPAVVHLQTTLDTEVPIDMNVPVRLNDTLQLRVRLEQKVPIRTVVRYSGPVQIDTRLTTRVFGIPMTFPVQGSFPVSLDIPLDQDVAVAVDAPVTAVIDQVLSVPLKFALPIRIPIDQAMSIPFDAPLDARITTRSATIDTHLRDAVLSVPLHSVSVRTRAETARGAPAVSP